MLDGQRGVERGIDRRGCFRVGQARLRRFQCGLDDPLHLMKSFAGRGLLWPWDRAESLLSCLQSPVLRAEEFDARRFVKASLETPLAQPVTAANLQ